MAKVVVKSKVKKVKRKFPVEVKAPSIFSNQSLGKSNTTDLSTFVGKSIKMNLMYITKNVKNQNIRLTLKVTEVNSGVANTEVTTYEQIPYYLNRFVKAGSDLVEDSFVYESKDKKKIRIKPFIITKKITSMMIINSIRAKIREIIAKEVAGLNADDFIKAVIDGKTQKTFRTEVKKVFPLKTLEFKKIIIE